MPRWPLDGCSSERAGERDARVLERRADELTEQRRRALGP